MWISQVLKSRFCCSLYIFLILPHHRQQYKDNKGRKKKDEGMMVTVSGEEA